MPSRAVERGRHVAWRANLQHLGMFALGIALMHFAATLEALPAAR
jgi:hypothetical protein